MNYRQVFGVAIAVFLLGVCLGGVGEKQERDWLIVVGIIVLCSSFVLNYIYYRCPFCREHLGRGWASAYCRHCGKRLEDGLKKETPEDKE